MNITPLARKIGRRNFLKAVGGASALAALGTTAVLRGPKRGGPVRAVLIGYGRQGQLLQSCTDPEVMDLVAVCDIRPETKDKLAGLPWYQDWRQMLDKERIEAVVIATPLCTHAEISAGSLEAGKHVFCETSMALNLDGCKQMVQAAEKSKRLLAIGYQGFYEPLYWAAYQHIIGQGLLGDIYTVKAVWHSDDSGRVEGSPDAANFDPRKWGYATEEQLRNWRLYKRYANGPADERGGALISLTNWFLGAVPNAVQATGGNFSYKDGRDVNDQIFATLEYPNGRIATLSLLESNGFEGSYTQFMGTKGTLIVGQGEALLFTEEGSHPSTVGVAKLNSSQPVVNASASRSEESSNHSALASGVGTGHSNPMEAFQSELAGFCGAIRSGAPLRSDAAHAYEVARTCTAIRESVANSRTQYA